MFAEDVLLVSNAEKNPSLSLPSGNTTPSQNGSITAFLISTYFKKSKSPRASLSYLHIISALIWLFGKAFYIYALFSLYNHLLPSNPEAQARNMFVMLLLTFVGAFLGAVLTELGLYQILVSLTQREQITIPKNIIPLDKFLQQFLTRNSTAKSSEISASSGTNASSTNSSADTKQQKIASLSSAFPKLLMHASLLFLSTVIWLFAFKTLAPMRIVVLENMEYVFMIVFGGYFGWIKKNKFATIGTQNLVLLVVALGLFMTVNDHYILDHVYRFKDVFVPNVSFQGLLNNLWGVGLLVVAFSLNVIRKNHARSLSNELFPSQPEPGKIFWIACVLSGALAIPFIGLSFILTPIAILKEVALISNGFYMILYGCGIITIPYYAERISKELLEFYKTNVPSSAPTLFPSTDKLSPPLSWRIVISFVLSTFVFGYGCHFISVVATPFLVLALIDLPYIGSNLNSTGGDSLILPLLDSTSNQLLFTTQPISKRNINGLAEAISVYLKFIMANKDSRYLFFFLLVNFAFMFVELIYGVLSNSLGLISDSAHMLFDCGALAIGLYGAFMSKWKPDQTYTYGFVRFEVLSAFVNGLLLVFISCYIFIEAFQRLFDPPAVEGERLLLISVMGLIINLLGVFFFGHAHSDNGNENIYGVYLHMLMDALGSVSVITSTLLIQYFGWNLADPVCSIIISGFTMSASIPLINSSVSTLLQRTPEESEQCFAHAIEQVEATEGVIQVYNPHFWTLSSGQTVGSCRLKVKDEANQQIILKQVSETFKKEGVQNMTVQIEKSSFVEKK